MPAGISTRIPSGDSRWIPLWIRSSQPRQRVDPEEELARLVRIEHAAPAMPARSAVRGGTPATVMIDIAASPSSPSRLATA